ncbi:MAG: hypothetical protein H6679_01440 [Epsilonproteobacteria bacterium]|nr:hypothetical protein [Campylobacterota bacterium]
MMIFLRTRSRLGGRDDKSVKDQPGKQRIVIPDADRESGHNVFKAKWLARRACIALLLVLATTQNVHCFDWSWLNPFGKRYEKQSAQDAISQLQKEQVNKPLDPNINYNLGVASYKAGKYADAIANFGRSLQHSNNEALKIQSLFNLGNSHYKNALSALPKKWEDAKTNVDLKILDQAIESAKSSIARYDELLDLDLEDDEMTHTNKKAAETLLKKLEEKKQQQQQKNDQKQNNKDQKNQDNDQNDQDQDDNDQQNQDQDNQQDSQDNESDNEQNDQKQNKKNKQDKKSKKNKQDRNNDRNQDDQQGSGQDEQDNSNRDEQDRQDQQSGNEPEADEQESKDSGHDKQDDQGEQESDQSKDKQSRGDNNPTDQQERNNGGQDEFCDQKHDKPQSLDEDQTTAPNSHSKEKEQEKQGESGSDQGLFAAQAQHDAEGEKSKEAHGVLDYLQADESKLQKQVMQYHTQGRQNNLRMGQKPW